MPLHKNITKIEILSDEPELVDTGIFIIMRTFCVCEEHEEKYGQYLNLLHRKCGNYFAELLLTLVISLISQRNNRNNFKNTKRKVSCKFSLSKISFVKAEASASTFPLLSQIGCLDENDNTNGPHLCTFSLVFRVSK